MYTHTNGWVEAFSPIQLSFISGKWKANVKHGTAEEIYPNGDKFIGTYVDGQRTGINVIKLFCF